MKKTVVFGNGQMAEIAAFYLKHDSPCEIAAFTIDGDRIRETIFQGKPVMPFEELERAYPPDKYNLFAPISYTNVNALRAQKYLQGKEKGYRFISYVSSKAITWPGLKIGENCMIFENNVIQPFVLIGNNVILWSGNHIGHHTQIKDHCYLASQIVVSGRVIIEPYCFIGVNATIRDNITIGQKSVIGAGAVILKNTREKEVYASRSTDVFPKPSDQLRSI